MVQVQSFGVLADTVFGARRRNFCTFLTIGVLLVRRHWPDFAPGRSKNSMLLLPTILRYIILTCKLRSVQIHVVSRTIAL